MQTSNRDDGAQGDGMRPDPTLPQQATISLPPRPGPIDRGPGPCRPPGGGDQNPVSGHSPRFSLTIERAL
jgi:hypothetical protein